MRPENGRDDDRVIGHGSYSGFIRFLHALFLGDSQAGPGRVELRFCHHFAFCPGVIHFLLSEQIRGERAAASLEWINLAAPALDCAR